MRMRTNADGNLVRVIWAWQNLINVMVCRNKGDEEMYGPALRRHVK